MKKIVYNFCFLLLSFYCSAQIKVIQALQMLDVKTGKIISPAVIVVKDGLIQAINPNTIPTNSLLINLPNKTLLPGLIDCHAHLQFEEGEPTNTLLKESMTHAVLRSAKNAKKVLLAGFTTIRTVGQDYPSIELIDAELMKAEEQGLIEAPRIIPCGHAISITGGHYDLSMADNFTYGVLEYGYQYGIADGVDDVTKAVRYQIKHGAKWIKITATGGVMSTEGGVGSQFSQEELNAIVQEAARHNIKVAAHAHGTAGIIAAIKAGVASIEHGTMLDFEAIQLMLKNGTYLVPTSHMTEIDVSGLPEIMQKKQAQVVRVAQQNYRDATKAKVKLAFGSDAGGFKGFEDGDNAKEFGTLIKLGMANIEAIRTATLNAADLLSTKDRGVLDVGKLADIIAVDGNPLDDINLLIQVKFVMKGGIVYKNE
jgi:imidazolonepropionase-like amidohydrolase